MSKYLKTSLLISVVCSTFISQQVFGSIEREQEAVSAFVNQERQVMLHFLQGKGFFKDGNYQAAKEEFEQVVQLDPNHEGSYIYLDRIEDQMRQKQLEYDEKYKQVNKILDTAQYKEGEVSYDPKGLTDDQKTQIDKYLSRTDFQEMMASQKRDITNKTAEIKEDIKEILSASKEQAIAESIKSDMPFLFKGFEERGEMPEGPKEKAEYIVDKEKDINAEIYFDTKKKLKAYYEKGLIYFRQKDYTNAKKYFGEILKMDPNYKYAREYYDSSKSKVILDEIRERRAKEAQLVIPNRGDVVVQEPIDLVSERKAIEQSLEMSREIGKEYTSALRQELSENRKNMMAQGIALFRQKDYSKALEIFNEILIKYPKDSKIKKYKTWCEEKLAARDAAMLNAFDEFTDKIDVARLEPATPKEVLESKAKRLAIKSQVEEEVLDKAKKTREYYEDAIRLYKQKDYKDAGILFEKVISIEPSNNKAVAYLKKSEAFAIKQEKIEIEKQIQLFFAEAKNLFSINKYKEAGIRYWKILQLSPNNKNAKKLLDKCSTLLNTNLAAEIEREEKIKDLTEQEKEQIYENAKTLYRQGDYKNAAVEFEKVVAFSPEHPYAGRYLERCNEKIAAGITTPITTAPAVPAKTTPEAVGTAPALRLGQSPYSPAESEDEIYARAKDLYRSEQYADAIPEFEKVLALNPNHNYAGRYIQACREKLGQPVAVPSVTPTVTPTAPTLAPAVTPAEVPAAAPTVSGETEDEIYARAKDLYRNEQYADAIPEFEKVLALNPDHRYAGRYIQACQEKLGQMVVSAPVTAAPTPALAPTPAAAPAPAAPMPTPAVTPVIAKPQVPALTNSEIDNIYNAGKNLYRQKQYQNAINEFQKILAVNPEHKNAKNYIEECEKRIRRIEARKEPELPLLKQPAEQAPTEEVLYKNKADRLYEQGKRFYEKEKYQKAIEYFKQALALDPKHEYAQRYIESAAEKMIDAGEVPAIEGMDEKRAGYNEEEVYNNGKVLYREAKYEEAIVEFDKVTKMNPEHAYASRYLEACKEKLRSKGVAWASLISKEEVKDIPKKLSVEQAYNDAIDFYNKEDYKKSAIYLKKIITINPQYKESKKYYDLSKSKLIEIEKIAPSITEADRFLSQETNSDRIYEQAKKLYKEEKYADAVLYFERILDLNPNHKYAGRYLERCQEMAEEQEMKAGEEKKEEAPREVVESFDVREVRIDMSKEDRSIDDIYKSGRAFFGIDKFSQAYLEFSKVMLLDAAYKDVESYIRRCVTKLTVDKDEYSQLQRQGQEYISKKMYADALDVYNKLLVMKPEDAHAKEMKKISEEKLNIKDIKEHKEKQQSLKSEILEKVEHINMEQEPRGIDDIYNDAKRLYRDGNLTDAYIEFKKVLLLDPVHPYAGKYIERCEKSLGITEEIKQDLSKVDKEKRDELFEEGRKAFANKKYEDAMELFTHLVKIDPEHDMAKSYIEKCKDLIIKSKEKHFVPKQYIGLSDSAKDTYLYAVKLFNTKHFEQAKIQFEKVLINSPDHEYSKLYLKDCRAEIKIKEDKINEEKEQKRKIEEEKAKQAAEKAGKEAGIRKSEEAARKAAKKAAKEAATKKYKEVKIAEKKAVVQKTDEEKKIEAEKLKIEKKKQDFIKAGELYDSGKYKEAIAIFKKLSAEYPKESELIDRISACEIKIEVQEQREKIEKVFEEKRQAMQKEKDLMETSTQHFDKGVELYDTGEYSKALLEFEKVLELTPDNNYAKMLLGYCNDKLADSKVIAIEKEKIGKHPVKEDVSVKKEAERFYEKGVAYYKNGDFKSAKTMFSKVLESDPDRKEVLSYIDECNKMILEKGKDRADKTDEIKKYFDQGKLYFKKKLYPNAIAEFKKAWELGPQGLLLEEIQVYLEKSYEMQLEKDKKGDLGLSDKEEEAKEQVDIDEWIEKGKAYIEDGKIDLAMIQFEKVLILEPKHELALAFKEYSEKKQQEKKVKEKEMIKALARQEKIDAIIKRKKEVSKLIDEGKVLYQNSAYKEAEGKFNQALKIEPYNDMAKDYLALCNESLMYKRDN